jgi:hypothetical protein
MRNAPTPVASRCCRVRISCALSRISGCATPNPDAFPEDNTHAAHGRPAPSPAVIGLPERLHARDGRVASLSRRALKTSTFAQPPPTPASAACASVDASRASASVQTPETAAARPEKNLLGVLTVEKTVIRFRPNRGGHISECVVPKRKRATQLSPPPGNFLRWTQASSPSRKPKMPSRPRPVTQRAAGFFMSPSCRHPRPAVVRRSPSRPPCAGIPESVPSRCARRRLIAGPIPAVQFVLGSSTS